MSSESMDDGTALFVALFVVALIALALWLAHGEYRDCMAKKHDEIACRTYVNSFF